MSDERCPHCNDDGVIHTHDGIELGPCDCADRPVPDPARQVIEAAAEVLGRSFDSHPSAAELAEALAAAGLLRTPNPELAERLMDMATIVDDEDQAVVKGRWGAVMASALVRDLRDAAALVDAPPTPQENT